MDVLQEFFPQLIIDQINNQLIYWEREIWHQKIKLVNNQYLSIFVVVNHQSSKFASLVILSTRYPNTAFLFNYRDANDKAANEQNILHLNFKSMKCQFTGYVLPANY